jgi:hypothetical protein
MTYRLLPVGGAPMPEAAVHEDRDLLAREDDVNLYPKVLRPHGAVFPEAKAQAMQGGPDFQLRLGIRTTSRTHGRGDPGVDGLRSGAQVNSVNPARGCVGTSSPRRNM